MANESNVLEIIQGIAQAAANSYDGAHDERFVRDGEVKKVGLKREEGDILMDKRVMDGFKVFISGNELCIKYHSETHLDDIYSGSFEQDTEEMLDKIAAFLKKEFKAITKKSLTLTAIKEREFKPLVQYISRFRTWVQAQKWYKIGNLGNVEPVSGEPKEKLNESIRQWIDQREKFPGLNKEKKNA